jgi:hypothetical protein
MVNLPAFEEITWMANRWKGKGKGRPEVRKNRCLMRLSLSTNYGFAPERK